MVRPLTSSAGFTYLAVLIMVIILGIMQGVAYQYMSTVMKREREEELLFRGQQIVEAIARWNNVYNLKNQPNHGTLKDLKDLLKDPMALQTTRYLRRDPTKEYNDPITGKEWEVIRDPSGQKGIIGVKSTSKAKPLKTGGFAESRKLDPKDRLDACLIAMYKGFEGASLSGITPITTTPVPTTPTEEATPTGKKYSDWQFVYVLPTGVVAPVPGQ